MLLDTAIGVLLAGTFAAGVLLICTIKGFIGDLMGLPTTQTCHLVLNRRAGLVVLAPAAPAAEPQAAAADLTVSDRVRNHIICIGISPEFFAVLNLDSAGTPVTPG
jgi:hypothetical protein